MPRVIDSQPLLTTSLIRARRSVTSSRMLIGGAAGGGSSPAARARCSAAAAFFARRRRVSGPSTTSRPCPIACAARSLTMIATNAARMPSPVNMPATARSVRADGRVTLPNQSAPIATTGSAMRAITFQTPVTMTEVDVARREKPHDRQIA